MSEYLCFCMLFTKSVTSFVYLKEMKCLLTKNKKTKSTTIHFLISQAGFLFSFSLKDVLSL